MVFVIDVSESDHIGSCGFYPAIEADSSGSEIKSAESMFQILSQQIFPEYKCALVHSKIDEQEQANILLEFKKGTINILAATTVIEVGVDVANATCIVIEQADRFGLAQLHQLGGRVGRNSEQSFCFFRSRLLARQGLWLFGEAY